MTIHNIASYSLSVAGCQENVKTKLTFWWSKPIFACGFRAIETPLGAGLTVVRTFGRVIEPGVRVAFDGISRWACAICIRQVHVGATSQQECANNNNCSQFFSLSTEFTSSKASSGKVKDLPPTTADTAVYSVPDWSWVRCFISVTIPSGFPSQSWPLILTRSPTFISILPQEIGLGCYQTCRAVCCGLPPSGVLRRGRSLPAYARGAWSASRLLSFRKSQNLPHNRHEKPC